MTLTRTVVWLGLVVLAFGAHAQQHDCVIEPRQTVDVRAPLGGLIVAVHAARGEVVEAGQLLVEIDAGVERASADLARFRATMQGAIRSAESRLEFATIKAIRRTALADSNFVSVQDRDEALAEQRVAQAALLEARDNAKLAEYDARRAEEQLRLKRLVSPIRAVVTERLMHPGETADGGDVKRPILRLAELSTLHVEVLMPLDSWGSVTLASPVEVLPESPIGSRHAARVVAIDRVMDAASRTYGVRLELPNPGLRIPGGIRCKAVFRTSAGRGRGGG